VRALLTPEVVPRLGVVLFKPGKELMRLFRSGRVLMESEPKSMAGLEAGRSLMRASRWLKIRCWKPFSPVSGSSMLPAVSCP
jgi:hypothetical protein